jgi:predicted restriction endonuclease
MNWTRAQVLAALHLYVQLPFGQLHSKNSRIRQLAGWMGRTPGSVAMKLSNLASLDPQITASGRRGLDGASALDKQVWSDLQAHWDSMASLAAEAFEHLAAQHGLTALQADAITEPELAALPPIPDDLPEGRERQAVVKQRVNQARFRRSVLASYLHRCCITGLSVPGLLVASHIKPWHMDAQNRLNPRNGLCLSALHDRAFDIGLITVTPGDHVVRVSKELQAKVDDPYMTEALINLRGRQIQLPELFAPSDEFLGWHSQHFHFA